MTAARFLYGTSSGMWLITALVDAFAHNIAAVVAAVGAALGFAIIASGLTS